MAYPSSTYSSSPVVALSVLWRGSPRTLRLNPLAGAALAALLGLLAIWSLGATGYLVFHDQLMSALLSRQADMQYSYEDRIATLRTQLDRQTSRALVDHQALTTTMQDLASRSAQLEARAGTIETLVHGFGSEARTSTMARATPRTDNPLLAPLAPLVPQVPAVVSAYQPTAPAPASPALRLDRDTESEAGGDHAELSPDQENARLSVVLARVEMQQAEAVARLRAPTVQAIARFERALADTGLPASHWRPGGDVGGPFVPLPEGARTGSFDQDVALLREAMVERARLVGLADKIPLRRPLEGALEVTSPFGGRLDPFYGRAAMHTGMDLMGGYGGPVHATAAGIVTVAGPEGGYGNMVEIDHGNGLTTRYAHLGSIDVVPHEKVLIGTIVGRVGATGRATGPHLHYETRINGDPVDPARFLKAGAVLAD